jgi:ElaB/YqjD/DUF883 family membrane-anchored ribosome-binding protein
MASVDEEVAKLRKDMDQIRGDLGTLTEALKAAGVEQGQAAVNRARQAGGQARREADAWKAKADREIEEHPLTSVLMSFGIGFLIGMLLDRRR